MHHQGIFPLILLLKTALARLTAAEGAAWPEWRGPDRNGVAASSPPLIDSLPAEQPLLWTAELSAEGKSDTHASPIIADGRVYVHSAVEIKRMQDGKKRGFTHRILAAVNLADGEELWRIEQEGGKAHDTPCAHAGRVYWVDGHGQLRCLEGASGEEVWSVAVRKKKGTNSSPLVVGDLLVVPVGRDVTARALADGSERWSIKAKVWNNSPVLWTHDGKDHVLVGNEELLCLDPADGSVLWKLTGTDRKKDPSSPAVHGDLMATMFEGGGLRVHRLTPAGAELVVEAEGFEPQGGGAHQADSPVFDGKRIYGIDGDKTFCYDLEQRAMAWTGKKGDTHSSPVLADDKLIVRAKHALLLFAADSGELLGEAKVSAASCSSYALADGKLVTNAGTALYCYDFAKP